MLFFLKRFFCILLSCTFLFYLENLFFSPIFKSEAIIIKWTIHPFNICTQYPKFWSIFKILFQILFILSSMIISNRFFSHIFKNSHNRVLKKRKNFISQTELVLLVGKDYYTKEFTFLTEKSLYQNILITGTIGSGKTSSAMYPFTKQLISYQNYHPDKKLGMLILDVKGNFYKQVITYINQSNRQKDLIIVELGTTFSYNPLDKPNLKASILANRLKTILLLFSDNNSDSYWLDKVEILLTYCIKFCRIYNNNYVTFQEIHTLITSKEYYLKKKREIRSLFLKHNFSKEQEFDLSSIINFFEKEFFSLDSRTSNIIISEVTRITNLFVSDYEVLSTFSPEKNRITFTGFSSVLKEGKIVVLNMPISEYKNLSKIIAAYLKLDFQTEVLLRLKESNLNFRSVAFICDEFHEYVNSTDADFFAQSREAKCINIISTQSYTSLINSLNNIHSTRVVIQSLVNKIWFRSDDLFTIEDAQKQLGKEEKEKISQNISENAKETKFNYLLNSFNSKKSSLSEGYTKYFQSDFIYDTNFFTQELETFSCLSFLSDGNKILKPRKLQMIPYFKEKGWIIDEKK